MLKQETGWMQLFCIFIIIFLLLNQFFSPVNISFNLKLIFKNLTATEKSFGKTQKSEK